MRGVLGFVGIWLHLTASIYVAFVLFWGGAAFFQRDEGITLAAMQAGLSAIYILPFVPFRSHILQAKFPFTGQIALFEAQLYHYKARAYDPRWGRFLQTEVPLVQSSPTLLPSASRDPPPLALIYKVLYMH